MLVYLNWAWAWVTYSRGARLITAIDRQTHDHADAGGRQAGLDNVKGRATRKPPAPSSG